MRPFAFLLLLALAGPAFAHGGEDHADAAPMPAGSGDQPVRLADGSVYLPKPTQRRLGLRTRLAEPALHAAVLELNGKVIADPQAGGKVQATLSGRVEAGPRGLPVLGQRVAKGEVLAQLKQLPSSLERGSQQAQVADLAAQIETAQRRVQRLEQLEGVVPAREIEAARIELQGMQARRAALSGSFGGEALRAPVAGVVAAVGVVAGQVVEARETLFEIVDPQRLAVEALAYEVPVDLAAEATAAVPGGCLKLAYLGSGRVLREGALPVLFRIVVDKAAGQAMPPVAVGQPLKVLARTRATRQGVAVPLAAVTRNTAGEAVVWLHVGAERFLPRPVQTMPLDATSLLVVAGLQAGERVVVQGAALLAQVR